jgi:hypothetical protein
MLLAGECFMFFLPVAPYCFIYSALFYLLSWLDYGGSEPVAA